MLNNINIKRAFITSGTALIIIILAFSLGNVVVDINPIMNGIAGGGKEQNEAKPVDENSEEEKISPEEERRQLEAERKQREETLRDELGHFFVPLPPLEQEPNPKVKARGLYLTAHSVGLKSRYENILELVESTELNSLVIDVKDDRGKITYNSEIEYVHEVNSQFPGLPISDLKAVLDDLHERDIYPIARVVIFKDSHLADTRHDLAIQRADRSGVWRNNKGVAWVNPYKKEVWEYNIAVAKEVALLGFREIQFDYVRFPEGARFIEDSVYYPENNDIDKDEIIAEFLKYAREQLEDYNVHIAADTFGVIATSWGDSDMIGQTWEKIAPLVDYNCPMIYPSHYGPGYFGFAVPDANPEGTIRRALEDSIKRNAQVENPGIIRPWLQAFTASWIPGNIPYGAREVRLQIDTALKLGIDEYLIWHAGNVYPRDAFLSNKEAERQIREIEERREEKGHDYLGRTAKKAVEVYIDAVNRRDWREAFSIQGTGFKIDPEKYKNQVREWTAKINDFDLIIGEEEDATVPITVDLELTAAGEKLELSDEQWQVVMENNVWKVVPSYNFLNALSYRVEEES